MAESKLVQFVQLLERRTAEGKVVWEQTAQEGVYQAAFPQYAVTIRKEETMRSGMHYLLQILDEQGRIIEEVRGEGPPPIPVLDKPSALDQLLSRLYGVARRQAMGVDKALDDLLATLKDED